MHNYKELEVWKESIKFCPIIYKLVRKFPEDEKFGLVSQLKIAVISIPSNIAEGSAKSSDKHFGVFLETSLGSCYEVETQLLLSLDLGIINQEEYDFTTEKLTIIIKMLIRFIKYLNNK